MRRHGEEGFGLLEVIIALSVLLIVLIPLGFLSTGLVQQSDGASQSITANQIAEQWVETIAATNPAPTQYPATVNEPSTTVGGVTYRVRAYLSLSATSGASLCTVGSIPQIIALTVRVRWGNHHNSILDSTKFNPNSQIISPTDGFLALQIFGDNVNDTQGNTWGTRVNAVPVTITSGSTSISAYPDSTGCVFAELPAPASYSVSLGQPVPTATSPIGSPDTQSFVAPLGQSTSEGPYSVTAGGTSYANILYFDEGMQVGLTQPGTTAVELGVVCTTSGSTCVTGGEGPNGSSPQGILFTGSSSTWSTPYNLTSVSRIDSVDCPNSGAACMAIAATPSGAPVTLSYNGASWSPVALPSSPAVTAISQLNCHTSGTCYAVGTTSSGPEMLEFVSGAWVASTPPAETPAITAVTQLTCRTATSCQAVGTTSSGPLMLSYSSGTWSASAEPTETPAITGVSQLTCPPTPATTCYAVGTTSGAPWALSYSGGTWSATALPANTPPITAVSQLSCPASGSCFAVGTTSSGPVLISYISGTLTAAPVPTSSPAITAISLFSCIAVNSCSAIGTTSAGPVPIYGPVGWSVGSFPVTMTSVSQLLCPVAGTCFAEGLQSPSGTSSSDDPIPVIMSASGSSWSVMSAPSGVIWYSQITCAGSGADCYTTAVDQSGDADVLVDVGGTAGPWTQYTLSTTTPGWTEGATEQVDVGFGGGLTDPIGSTVVPTPLASPLGPIYPNPAGYSLWLGTCNSTTSPLDIPAVPTPVAVTPGETASVTPPMGVLAAQVVTAAGTPVSGATISAQSGCSTDPAIALQTTQSDGISSMAVPPGTYTLTVTAGALHGTATVTVNQFGQWNPVQVVVS